MADDGAELSLDDYIKVKKKQGAFKVGRGGGGVKGFRTKRVRKEIRARPGKNVGQQQTRGGSPAKNRRGKGGQGRGGRAGGTGRGRYFANNIVTNNTVQRSPQRRRARVGLKNWSGNRQNQNRASQIIHPLMTNNFQRNRYQNRGGSGGGYGFSQNLVRQARQRLRFIPSIIQPRNYSRVGPRPNNRKVVMKLARKRVQRARLQLNRQGRLRGPQVINNRRSGGIRSLLPLLSVTSGIRRTRTGFVTVSNPVEKQLQRLVVKEKIQKARQVKDNRAINYSNTNSFSSITVQPGPRRGGQQSQGYRQQPHGSQPRQHIMPLMNTSYQPMTTYRQPQRHYQSTAHNNNATSSRASLNQNQRSIPAMGMSMYADQEEAHRVQHQHPISSLQFTNSRFQHQNQQQHFMAPSSNPFEIRRTTVNHMYDPTHPAIDYNDSPHGLNPDIQRKINFIQNHGNRSDTANEQRGRGPREIIPDFRAPVSSSTMKLGDRFKMYMQ